MNQKFYIEAKVKKIDKDIKKAIKKANIQYPHPSLAFFKATYAKLEEANGNGVMLADSVKDDVSFLIGTQMNKNHYRSGYIMGEIIDAYLTKDNEIEVIFSFHKSVYPKEYEQALELMQKGKLTVSFELRVADKDVEVLANKVKKLHKVEFDGVGLLFAVRPAYRNAFVLETAMQQIENLFNQSNRELMFANINDIASKWTKIGQLIEETVRDKQSGGTVKMNKKAKDALLAKFKEDVTKELGEEVVKDWSEEQWEAELQKRAETEEKTDNKASEENKEEAKSEETQTEEKKEESASYECECLNCGKVFASEEHCKESKCPECGGEARRKDRPSKKNQKAEEETEEETAKDETKKEEAQKTVVEREKKTKETNEYDDETKEEKLKVESETVVTRDGKKTMEEKVKTETTYSYAQVEEIKADYEKKLQEKDKEISFIKENATKIAEIRAEFGDFVKDYSDEDLFNDDKMEIAKLKKENAELKEKKTETASEKEEDSEKETEKDDDTDLKATEDAEKKVEEKEETSDDRIKSYLKKYNKK